MNILFFILFHPLFGTYYLLTINLSVQEKYLIVIGGPTASGKTALAIQLAQHFFTEILSADSRQCYREMAIGTAKPSEEELATAKHHGIDNLSIHDTYSVGDFERDALAILDSIFEKNQYAIMVGGTGLYIKAVCEGLDVFPDTPLSIRTEFEALLEMRGIEYLQKMLQEVDNDYFMQVDINNPNRLIRALSVWKASGKPYSHFLSGNKNQRTFTPIYICVDLPRATLYERINKRVDIMMAHGQLEEAQHLLPYKNLNALQTVGYAELFDYFEGKMTLPEAIDKIKQHTRNYAKRQVTWFKKDSHWRYFALGNITGITDYITTFCKMGNSNWIDQAISFWQEKGIKLNTGLSKNEIAEFEKLLNYSFPQEFIELYQKVNGFEDFGWNNEMFSLWSLDRVLKEYQESNVENYIGFSDYLINSHQLGFLKEDNRIYKNYDFSNPIADNFKEVIALINSNSVLIY